MKSAQLSLRVLFSIVFLICGFAIVTFIFDEHGMFAKVDDGPFILLVLVSVAFLFLWLYEGLIKWTNRAFKVESKFVYHGLALLGGVLFFGLLVKLDRWEPSSIQNIGLVTLSILPTYLLFQWLLNKSPEQKRFLDIELLKLVFITLLPYCCFLLARYLIRLTAPDLDAADSQNAFFSHFMMFLMFNAVIGSANFLNNLRKRFSHLSDTEKRLEASQKEVLETKASLDSLQASVNPHFLYNSLNSIAGLAKLDPEKTEKMSLALSKFYRYVTNKEEKRTTDLKSELEMIQAYLAVEKIRFEEKLVVEVKCPLTLMDRQIPFFILQPIVENAIKYGYDGKDIKLSIEISLEGDDLEIKVFDSGADFDENMSIGYGLKSVHEKLRLLHPDKHELAFINAPQKHVYIRINN